MSSIINDRIIPEYIILINRDIHIENNINDLIHSIEQGAPEAQKNIKSLLNSKILSKPINDRDTELADLISMIKNGQECEEGINSFLEKRKPNWVN